MMGTHGTRSRDWYDELNATSKNKRKKNEKIEKWIDLAGVKLSVIKIYFKESQLHYLQKGKRLTVYGKRDSSRKNRMNLTAYVCGNCIL